MSACYGYADVGRFGLAHSLMAWSRCAIWCEQYRQAQIASVWLRPRLGPYLRRERDKRDYVRFFNAGGDITGARRLYLLAAANRVVASASEDPDPASLSPRSVVVFRNEIEANDQRFFHFVQGHHESIRRKLLQITKPPFRPAAPGGPFISVHVRFGDFAPPASESELTRGMTNRRLPIEWYLEMLSAIARRRDELSIVIYSDGSDEELAPILAFPGVTRSSSRVAVTDLLSMAQSQLMISSGSGLSRFGAFLGQVPRICYPGQRIVSVLDNPAMEVECSTASQADSFLRQFLALA